MDENPYVIPGDSGATNSIPTWHCMCSLCKFVIHYPVMQYPQVCSISPDKH